MAQQTLKPAVALILVVIAIAIGLGVWYMMKKKENYTGYVGKINPVYIPNPQECTMCPFQCSKVCPNQNYANEQATIGNWFPNKAFIGQKVNRDEQYADEAHRSCCPNDLSGCPSAETAL